MMNEMRSHLPDLDALNSTGIDLKKIRTVGEQATHLGYVCKEYGITAQNLDEAMQRIGKLFDHHLPMIALKARTRKKLYG